MSRGTGRLCHRMSAWRSVTGGQGYQKRQVADNPGATVALMFLRPGKMLSKIACLLPVSGWG